MAWTKREFIVAALEEIGLTSAYDLAADELAASLKRLDNMMATWNANGLRLGYPLPDTPADSDIDDNTNVPDRANEAIVTNLAVRLAPMYGKTVSQDTKVSASQAYRVVANYAVAPLPRAMPNDAVPAGAGAKDPLDPFLPAPAATLDTGTDGVITL